MELFFGIMIIITVITGGGGAAVYFSAKEEWDKTFARMAMIARANLGSKKDKFELEMMDAMPLSGDKAELEAWTAEFEGRKSTELVLANKEYHKITRSWNELNDNYMDGVTERWFWECTCGVKEHRKTKEAAKNAAHRHIKLFGGRNAEGIKNQGWLRGVSG